jgi:pimeloyl-ACP methyl ester carboxylesterase
MLFSRQRYDSFITPTPLAADECLVIGFPGGLEAWDSGDQGVRKVALALRARNLPGVHVETVEEKKRTLALELIRRAFDRNRDGLLDEHERRSVRLIVYGMSFGGAAVVKLARRLEAMDIPILLTVQVDSVGVADGVIPTNVAAAANLYQRDGMVVRGERAIRAEDPAKTAILGNFRFAYQDRQIDLSGVPWYKLVFRVAHSKMNADPRVWAKVEALILTAIHRTESLPTTARASC